MSTMNPAARLYDDMLRILKNLTIKYSINAEENETYEMRSASEIYMNAKQEKDNFFSYRDYTEDEYKKAGVTYEGDIIQYMNNQNTVPLSIQQIMIENRRNTIITEYDEPNEYYRVLNGLPPLDTDPRDYFYAPKEYCINYGIPEDMPIHKIEDELGTYYITVLESDGVIDKLIEENPDKKYLQHLGSRRIDLIRARTAGNFSILYLDQRNVMESIHREFIRTYEKCRQYFLSVCYVHEYSSIIEYYDNFIALCIFLMTIQQVSARMISNAVDREFYDDYSIQLLYETYGVPFNKKIDELTQKQIVQNVNLLVQNKACEKVLLDISSILGFESVKIYEYYLMKEQVFDSNGRPVILWKDKWNDKLGKYEKVPNYEEMYDLHFQRVSVDEENLHKALMNPANRVEYLDLTANDPFWWEDDDLYHEIWEAEYNKTETKYLGVTIPYRMTEMLFQSIIQFHMIFDKSDELGDILVKLPKITKKEVPLVDVIILLCALMCRKYHLSGYITYAPSQILHILQALDRDINHEVDRDIEIFKFDFEAFNPEIIEEMREMRLKEELDKLDEKEQDVIFVEEEQIRTEVIELMEYGFSRIDGFVSNIDSSEKESFIKKESNRLCLGTYSEEYFSKVKFILNSKLREDNYSVYFGLQYDKHWEADAPDSVGEDVIQDNADENDRTFTVYLRVKNNLEKTKEILEKHLIDRDYWIVNGHDISLNEDGTQNSQDLKKLRTVIDNLQKLYEFYDYLNVLSAKSLGSTKEEKIKALNNLYKNIKELYYFIAYRMSETNNYKEYYALKKFYDTVFYAKETKKAFKVIDMNGNEQEPETFLEYLKYKDFQLYTFCNELEENLIYVYIDHIIYKLEDFLDNVSHLYILNDGVSPLQELLVQLVEFFKSYNTDMVQLSSLMIMDWKMENTLRFIDHPQKINKEIMTKESFNLPYSDFMKRFTVKFFVDSKLKFWDASAIHNGIMYLKSNFFLTDEEDLWFDFKVPLYKVINAFMLKDKKFLTIRNEFKVIKEFKIKNKKYKEQEIVDEEGKKRIELVLDEIITPDEEKYEETNGIVVSSGYYNSDCSYFNESYNPETDKDIISGDSLRKLISLNYIENVKMVHDENGQYELTGDEIEISSGYYNDSGEYYNDDFEHIEENDISKDSLDHILSLNMTMISSSGENYLSCRFLKPVEINMYPQFKVIKEFTIRYKEYSESGGITVSSGYYDSNGTYFDQNYKRDNSRNISVDSLKQLLLLQYIDSVIKNSKTRKEFMRKAFEKSKKRHKFMNKTIQTNSSLSLYDVVTVKHE